MLLGPYLGTRAQSPDAWKVKGCGHLAISLPGSSQVRSRHQHFSSRAVSFGQGHEGRRFRPAASRRHQVISIACTYRDPFPCRRKCPMRALVACGVQRRERGRLYRYQRGAFPVAVARCPRERNDWKIPALCVISALHGRGACTATKMRPRDRSCQRYPQLVPQLCACFWSKRPPFHHHYRQAVHHLFSFPLPLPDNAATPILHPSYKHLESQIP